MVFSFKDRLSRHVVGFWPGFFSKVEGEICGDSIGCIVSDGDLASGDLVRELRFVLELGDFWPVELASCEVSSGKTAH